MKAIFKWQILFAVILLQCTLLQAQNYPSGVAYPTGSVTTIALPKAYNASGNPTPTRFNYTQAYVPYMPYTDTSEVTSRHIIYPSAMVTSYVDGMGRPMQTVWHGHGNNDVVMPYDNRPSLTYTGFLPYNTSGTWTQFQMNPFGDQKTFYRGTAYYPHEGGTSYGQDKLSYATGMPTVKAFAPGASFIGQNKGDSATTTIDPSTTILMYYADDAGNLQNFGFHYSAKQLTINTSYTPAGAITYSYTDKSGNKVCEKQFAGGSTWLTTYYVYNDMGRLIWIIPPKVNADYNISSSNWNTVQQYCYNYSYDLYGNIVSRHVPGMAGYTRIVYDSLNRPVLSQTPLMLAEGKWQFNIYDSRDRVVVSGLLTDTSSQATWVGLLVNGNTPNTSAPYYALFTWFINGFTGTYPTSIANCVIQDYNYYDNYAWASWMNRSFDSSMKSNFLTMAGALWPQPYMFTQGQLTASRVLVQDPTATIPNQWISSVYFYDQKGRVQQVQTQNPFNATAWDQVTMQYNFAGNKILDITQHNAWGTADKSATTIYNWYTYDDYYGRPTSIQQRTDGGAWRTIATYAYDNLGRLQSQNLGGVEQQDLRYNIRGQLTSINGDYLANPAGFTDKTFGDSLSYDFGFSQPRYDGMVSGMQWRGAQTAIQQSAYGYRYDAAGRLTDADYNQYNGMGWDSTYTSYTMRGATYDAGGNILTLCHRAPVPGIGVQWIDDLSYAYGEDGRLQKVADTAKSNYGLGDFQDGTNTGSDYSYDNDGNLASDSNKHISSITYTEHDLPSAVTTSAGTITNSYDADGNLLQKKIVQGSHTDVYRYWGPFTYRNDSLLYIAHAAGRARYLADSSKFDYDYFVTDHQGNVRTVVTADVSTDPTSYFASHELASSGLESSIFANIANVRDTRPYGGPGDQYAANLNGSDPNRTIGTAMLMQVMPGDKFEVSTQSYWDSNCTAKATPQSVLGDIINVLSTQAGGFNNGENNQTYVNNLFTSNNYLNGYEAIKDSITDTSVPPAYLNYIVFDNQMRIVPGQSGAIQIDPTSGSWQTIGTADPVTIGQAGYVAFYISNEGNTNVYFDHLSILHYQGRVLQLQDYYPYGLPVNEGEVAGPDNVHNMSKFEGNDHHEELGLDLADFNARQYDYQIGRFTSIDPMADAAGQEGLSPYHFAANDPANFVDPWGLYTLNEVTIIGHRKTASNTDGNVTVSTINDDPLSYYILMQGRTRTPPPQLEQLPLHGATGGSDGGGYYPFQKIAQIAVPKIQAHHSVNLNDFFLTQAQEDAMGLNLFEGAAAQTWNAIQGALNINNYINVIDGLVHSRLSAIPLTVKAIQTVASIKAASHQFQQASDAQQSYMLGEALAMIPQLIADPETAVGEVGDVSEVSTALRNGHLAGDVHPVTGVPFDANGFPDFSNYLYEGGPNDVMITPTGDRTLDIQAANNAAGYESTPGGYSWHHHQEMGRMQLVERTIHSKTGHTGGFSLWKALINNK